MSAILERLINEKPELHEEYLRCHELAKDYYVKNVKRDLSWAEIENLELKKFIHNRDHIIKYFQMVIFMIKTGYKFSQNQIDFMTGPETYNPYTNILDKEVIEV